MFPVVVAAAVSMALTLSPHSCPSGEGESCATRVSAAESRLITTGPEASWAELPPGALVSAPELGEVTGAVSRAKMRSPIISDACVRMGTAADGARTTVERKYIYYPIDREYMEMSSPFGYRINPVTENYELHTGDDYPAPEGTAIHAVADGEVILVSSTGSGGYNTKIRHQDADGSTYISWYCHQLPGSQSVREGEVVKAGQQIGQVGSTGNSTGPHLHLEIQPDGQPVPPAAWLLEHDAVFVGAECE